MRSAQLYEEEKSATEDGELNLGMGSLIGIFFGLALVCGVFFGFGYTMGHRPPGVYVPSEPLYVAPDTQAVAPKPSAQVPEQPWQATRVVIPANSADDRAKASSGQTAAAISEPIKTAALTPAPPARTAQAASAKPTPPAPVSAPLAAPILSSGTIMVQIAAVKNRPDAEALAAALEKNGFSPAIRTESQDKLLHVQVGPFAGRDDAKAMRQRLSNAGYNAFIK